VPTAVSPSGPKGRTSRAAPMAPRPPGRITNMCLDVDTIADMLGELAAAPAAAVRLPAGTAP